jgi:hypothetical protein
VSFRLIQFRRSTDATANSNNVTLASGEPGFETDSGEFAIGDGSTAWVDLPKIHNTVLTQAANIQPVSNAEPIQMICAGAIRNNGTPDYWEVIVDANHAANMNVASVVTGTSAININFTVPAGKRISAIAVCDESLSAKGFIAGASFSESMLQITLTRRFSISDYVYYDGSAWVSVDGRFTIDSYTSGILSMTHEQIEGRDVSLTSRSASLVPCISTGTSPLGDTSTKVVFRDFAGSLITTPSTEMKFYVTRGYSLGGSINPQIVDTTSFPLSNIWFAAFAEAA